MKTSFYYSSLVAPSLVIFKEPGKLNIIIYLLQETLRVKRDKLAEQLDEAKKLKANIDKRSSTVLSMLRKYLSDQVLADYDKFIKAKARLIMESRQINDKMASSQEQKTILKETTF